MPDITMCHGKGCTVANGCYRKLATPSEYQSYSEYEGCRGESSCSGFWPWTGDHARDKGSFEYFDD